MTHHELCQPGMYRDWPASICLRPNVLELSRHACQTSNLFQLHPVMSRPLRNLPDPYQEQCGTPGTPGKLGKVWPFWKTIQNTQYIGLGLPSWLTPTLNMWCMYVTSRPVGLYQRHPVGLPSSGSGDQSK